MKALDGKNGGPAQASTTVTAVDLVITTGKES